jgi:hypothetical protein
MRMRLVLERSTPGNESEQFSPSVQTCGANVNGPESVAELLSVWTNSVALEFSVSKTPAHALYTLEGIPV